MTGGKSESALPTLEQLQSELESANKRINELNKESLKHRKDAERIEAEKKQAEDAKLKEQGEFKTLLEKEQQAHQATQAQVKSLQREVFALKNSIPPSLADRLKGDTEEEWKRDAETLMKDLAPKSPTPPARDANRDASRGTGAPANVSADALAKQRESRRQAYRA